MFKVVHVAAYIRWLKLNILLSKRGRGEYTLYLALYKAHIPLPQTVPFQNFDVA
jgi:hypothetical protein